MMLDLESVRLFVLTAEYGSLTRAAEAAGTVQPVVSQRIKGLEQMLGRRLLDRTPRFVRLTEHGSIFLERARVLLAAHDAALAEDDVDPRRIALGVSDHVLGASFDTALRHIRTALPPRAFLTVKLGQSQAIREHFDKGDIDLAIIRRDAGASDGEVLGEDPLEWRVPPGWVMPQGPVPLVTLPPPCGVRAVALKALDRADIPWDEAFIGGSCLALMAAVRAGLGVAPLGRIVGAHQHDLGLATGLPSLPSSQIVMLARTPDHCLAGIARALAASVREMLS
ncbi:LysR family transcriptional regulator [Acidisoma cellulosilytica]|uniref:LysR family transcriptional regulator n=1 Tax=Acidisoma cellulosilyticum TaxID=2802395 RepID=A0A963Z496_9PROT|nr:LysR family transcriptional regulator [Acidisoma cellulosilyticum]MCB8882478.1 LysR family transcriptional regulator [Acidisoma cellulosilyticum]